MNQQFHVVMEKGNLTIRRPLPPDTKYDSKVHIHPVHEVRQFLEPLGEFAMASIAELDKASQVLDYGFVNQLDGRQWHVAGGFIRDDGAVFCLLPERVTDAEFYNRLGMRVVLPKWNDSFKVGKYIKRLWSHHRTYVQGDVIEEHGDVIIVRLDNGKTISVRYAPKSPLTEGMNLVSKKCLKLLGYEPAEDGTGLRITALSPRGFTKGHAIVLDHLHFDLVMYETKDMLKSDGRFTFALDELHSGKLFTDRQSVINFQFDQGPFLDRWSETFFRQVIDALKDEEKLRNMLRFYNIDFHKWNHDDPEHGAERGQYIDKEKDWALLRAMRSGVKITSIPALIRKVYHLFTQQVMDTQEKIRIPVQPDTGLARYVLVDPTIFDMWGNPTLDGVLRGNEVFVPGHIGPAAFHRQPNAHRGEHHIANSVHNPEHLAMDTGSFMFVSKDVIVPVLKKLGGGDQDDRVVIYINDLVVDHFSKLPAYPIEEAPVEVAVPEPSRNRFADLLFRPKPVYDRAQLKIMMSNQSQQRVSIGRAVNPIMMDTLISDQKNQIINYLVRQHAKEPNNKKIEAALNEMRKFEGFKLRKVASQLEAIIDAVKRDGADTSAINNEINAFWEWLPVTPEFMLTGGKFDGRLPNSRRGDALPVIVKTDLDLVLEEIGKIRTELEDFITEYSWQVVADIPEEITTYPDTLGDVQLARAIRQFYHFKREEIMSPLTGSETKARIQAFLRVDKAVYDQFKGHPIIEQGMIKLYQLVYQKRAAEAPRLEDGTPRPYPDGLLWGPYMSGLTIKALDRVELTGRYVDVQFYPDRKRYRRGEYDVLVGEGVVHVGQDEVGMTDPVADGTVKMEGGLIKVPTQAVKPVVTPEVDVLTVVAGWRTRPDSTPERIKQWKAQVSKQVALEPYVHFNTETGLEEHAVRVLLEGVEYGHISKRDVDRILVPTTGWLTPGKDPHTNTMTVTIKKR